jgi:hypothetical protein
VVLLSGCSLLFVDTPPAKHSGSVAPDCTTSAVAPAVDLVVAGLQTIRTGIALAADDADYADFPISRGADIGFGIGFLTLFAASAGYGFHETGKCTDMKRAAAARTAGEAEEDLPVTPTGTAAPRAAPAALHCTHDAQCKDARVCEHGACVEYQPKAQP